MLAASGGRIVNISASKSTMHRAGFVPYGPSVPAASHCPGSWPRTCETPASPSTYCCGGRHLSGMLPVDDVPTGQEFLDAAVMAPPIVWLASDDSEGVHAAVPTGRRPTIRSTSSSSLSNDAKLLTEPPTPTASTTNITAVSQLVVVSVRPLRVWRPVTALGLSRCGDQGDLGAGRKTSPWRPGWRLRAQGQSYHAGKHGVQLSP